MAIDHYLVDFVEGAVLELPGGCLCCAVREDLARTLRDLIDRRDAGDGAAVSPHRHRDQRARRPGADPLHARRRSDARRAAAGSARVVTVVDAENGAATLARFAEAARQAAMADALVISKTDLAPVSAQSGGGAGGAQPRRRADRRGRKRAMPELVLFGGASSPHPTLPRLRGREMASAGALPPPQAGEGRVGPEAVHTHGIDAFTVILGGEFTRLDFARRWAALAGARGTDLLRVKGIVRFADRPGYGGGQPPGAGGAAHDVRAGMARRLARLRPAQPAGLHRPRDPARGHPRAFRLCGADGLRTAGVPPACGREARGPSSLEGGSHARCRHHRRDRGSAVRGANRPISASPAKKSPRSARRAASPRSAPDVSSTLRARSSFPGGIDPHVHCRWPMPTPGQTQHNLTDGPDRVSQAALFGGTTTILDFALVDGDNTVQQAIERRQKEWAGDCHCDYAFHTMVQGKLALGRSPTSSPRRSPPGTRRSRCSPPTSPRRARAAWCRSATSGRC